MVCRSVEAASSICYALRQHVQTTAAALGVLKPTSSCWAEGTASLLNVKGQMVSAKADLEALSACHTVLPESHFGVLVAMFWFVVKERLGAAVPYHAGIVHHSCVGWSSSAFALHGPWWSLVGAEEAPTHMAVSAWLFVHLVR